MQKLKNLLADEDKQIMAILGTCYFIIGTFFIYAGFHIAGAV